MNNLLNSGKVFSEKSNAHLTDTENMLKHAFSEHAKFVSEALDSSERTMNNAIAVHTQSLNAMLDTHRRNALRLVSKTWICVILSLLLIFAVSWSALWYTGRLIRQNVAEIQAQNATLSKLEAKTWGIEFQDGAKGRFLVLPKGTTVDAEKTWHMGEGKSQRQALRLVQE